MKDETPINPRGTVRQRFARGRPWYANALETPTAQELGADIVHFAAELVAMEPTLDGAPRQAVFDAVLESLVALRNGSTRIPVPDAVAALADSGGCEWLIGSGADGYKPLVVRDGWLYHQRTLHYETSLGRAVRERLAEAPRQWETRAVAATLQAVGQDAVLTLSDEQRVAVTTAASMPLTVVTGGPGTGKTSIVVTLLRMLVRLGVDPSEIALGAPTGKAANRLGESIFGQLRDLEGEEDQALLEALEAAPPSTLHRMLRYSGDRGVFGRDESDPIEAQWVIVDEASMIDLVLMERLVRCVARGAHLVLLGDVEQLPSVDTGTVLRDLVTDAPHIARLRQSFRMDPNDPGGRSILELAGTVRDGDPDAALACLAAGGGVSFEAVEVEEYRAALMPFVDEWFNERITAFDEFWSLIGHRYVLVDGTFSTEDAERISRLFAHYDRFRILCLTRVFAAGTNALNEAFHARLARRTIVENAPELIPGEPVLMLRNDYDRGLFNGDHGLILRVDSGDEVRFAAVFADGASYRAHHLSGLYGQLAHAWAMTVHKSQGSEFDEVALLLPEEDMPLLSRELLYTAITRARKCVRITGPAARLTQGIQRVVQRYSGLQDFIR